MITVAAGPRAGAGAPSQEPRPICCRTGLPHTAHSFAHQYRPLGDDELAFALSRHWHRCGLTLDLTDFTDAQAVGRIVRGNFRLVHRLFVQIERVLKINDVSVITSDVVEAARSTVVIGDT